jgi:hypothetical protein
MPAPIISFFSIPSKNTNFLRIIIAVLMRTSCLWPYPGVSISSVITVSSVTISSVAATTITITGASVVTTKAVTVAALPTHSVSQNADEKNQRKTNILQNIPRSNGWVWLG